MVARLTDQPSALAFPRGCVPGRPRCGVASGARRVLSSGAPRAARGGAARALIAGADARAMVTRGATIWCWQGPLGRGGPPGLGVSAGRSKAAALRTPF